MGACQNFQNSLSVHFLFIQVFNNAFAQDNTMHILEKWIVQSGYIHNPKTF